MSDAVPPETPQTAPPKARPAGKLAEFISNMDPRAWTALAMSLGMVVVVAVMLIVGRLYYGDQVEAFIDSTLGEARRAHWGLPVTILVFTLTAYVGAPQFVLIGACVVAFGPEEGFWWSLIATIVSGVVTYYTGRLSSAQTQKRFGGATGGRFTRFMSKNGFLASLIVRMVPSGPFIVVNMAFGAARVSVWAFTAGLALGSVPKTALIAFAGDGIMDAIENDWGGAALMAVAAIVLWFFGVYVARRWLAPKMQSTDDN